MPSGARGWCWHKKHFCTCGAERDSKATVDANVGLDFNGHLDTAIGSSNTFSPGNAPALVGIDCEFSPWRVALVGPNRQVLVDALVITPPGTEQGHQGASKPRLDRILPADLATAPQVTPAEVRAYLASMMARQHEDAISSMYSSGKHEVDERNEPASEMSAVVGHTVDVDLERFYGSVAAGHAAIDSSGARVVDVCPPPFQLPADSSTGSSNARAHPSASQRRATKKTQQQPLQPEANASRSTDAGEDATLDRAPAPRPSRALKALLAAAGLPAVQTPGLRHCPVEDAFGALDLYCARKE